MSMFHDVSGEGSSLHPTLREHSRLKSFSLSVEGEGVLAVINRMSGRKGLSEEDVVKPEEAMRACGFKYGEDQLDRFKSTFPTSVFSSRDFHEFALVAGPPEPTSLSDIQATYPELFLHAPIGWHVVQREPFYFVSNARPEWYAIRKLPACRPVTEEPSWEMDRLRGLAERIPTVAEVVWCMVVIEKVRGIKIFDGMYVRTSDKDKRGHRVYVGRPQDGLIFPCTTRIDDSRSPMGIAAMRKLV